MISCGVCTPRSCPHRFLGVRSVVSKWYRTFSGIAHWVGQGVGGASSQSPVTPNGPSSSSQNPSSGRFNSYNTSEFRANKKEKQIPSGILSASQPSTAAQLPTASPCHLDFKCVKMNISRFSKEKWSIMSLPIVRSVSVIIVTEYHLSATFRTDEVIDTSRKMKQQHHWSGVAILYRDDANLEIEQYRITDGTNGSSHQAVSWTTQCPLISSPMNITCVYVSPREGEIEEFFHILTQ